MGMMTDEGWQFISGHPQRLAFHRRPERRIPKMNERVKTDEVPVRTNLLKLDYEEVSGAWPELKISMLNDALRPAGAVIYECVSLSTRPLGEREAYLYGEDCTMKTAKEVKKAHPIIDDSFGSKIKFPIGYVVNPHKFTDDEEHDELGDIVVDMDAPD